MQMFQKGLVARGEEAGELDADVRCISCGRDTRDPAAERKIAAVGPEVEDDLRFSAGEDAGSSRLEVHPAGAHIQSGGGEEMPVVTQGHREGRIKSGVAPLFVHFGRVPVTIQAAH